MSAGIYNDVIVERTSVIGHALAVQAVERASHRQCCVCFFFFIATAYSESPSPQPAIHVSSRFHLSLLASKPAEGGRGKDPILAYSGLSILVPSQTGQGKTRARDLGICRSTFLCEKWGSRALDSVRRRRMVRTSGREAVPEIP